MRSTMRDCLSPVVIMIVSGLVVCASSNSAHAQSTEWLITSSTPMATMPPPNLPIATGGNSLSAGPYAVSSGDNGTSFGYSAVASGPNASAFGSTSVASGSNSIAVGMLSRATGFNSSAVGNSSTASGSNAAAFGVSSAATGLNTTAIGTQAAASGTNSVALGNGSIATVANTVSFGIAGGERRLTNLSAGINATDGVNVSQLTALDVSVDNRISNAFTTFANWQGSAGVSSVAVGDQAVASAVGSIGIGQTAAATGTNSVALGTGAAAAGVSSTALGSGAAATGTTSSAFGSNATATAPNSVALGSGSIANQSNTVSVGSAGNERRITNVAAGSAPTDAVNMQQFQSASASTNARIDSLSGRIDSVDQQARRGIAATAALAPTIMPSKAGKTTVSVAGAVYRGEAALSIGAAHRLDLSLPTVVFGSYANAGGNDHVSRVGMAVEF